MGSFFNEKIFPMKVIPTNRDVKNSPLEKLRREFNEQTVYSEGTEQAGGLSPDEGDEGESVPDLATVVHRPKRTRRANKGRTRKARSDKGSRRSGGN